MAAQFGEATPQLRLENHNERHGEEDRKTPDDPADHDEVQQGRDQGQGEEYDREAGEDFGSAGAAKIKVAIVDPDAEQNDLDEAPPAFGPKLEDLLHHCFAVSKSSVTRKAATFSLTSWTRKTFAPRSRNSPVNAMVGASRSSIASEPIILPSDDLRETPTTSGRSSTRSRARWASKRRLCSTVFPNPIPGSNAMAIASTPHSRARLYCCRKKLPTSPTTSS